MRITKAVLLAARGVAALLCLAKVHHLSAEASVLNRVCIPQAQRAVTSGCPSVSATQAEIMSLDDEANLVGDLD